MVDIGGVSNDWDCEWEKHLGHSPSEYERMLLHRNYRTNMVHTEPEFTMIRYEGEDEPQPRETVSFMYQGIRFSDTILSYFRTIMEAQVSGKDPSEVEVPTTNQDDISIEMALVPNVHPDFRPQTSRSYYDQKYIQYKKDLREKYGIQNISSFALVDHHKDKTHTGKFRIKVQFAMLDGGTEYHYLVADVDCNGKIGNICQFDSPDNLVVCVCEDDFYRGMDKSSESSITKDAP